MASIDNQSDYVKIKDRIKSIKTYNDLKTQYSQVKKKAGDSFEKSNSKVNKGLDDFQKNGKKYANKEVKSQFEQLLEMLQISSSDYNDRTENLKSKKDKLNSKVNNLKDTKNRINNHKRLLNQLKYNFDNKLLFDDLLIKCS